MAIVALALPTLAGAAATTDYEGTFAGDTGSVSFRLVRDHGDRVVKRWRWQGLPVTCTDGEQQSRGRYLFDLRVRDRAFRGRAVRREAGEVVGGAKVTGTFQRGYASASGELRVWGEIPTKPPHEGCEGTSAWTAAEAITPVR